MFAQHSKIRNIFCSCSLSCKLHNFCMGLSIDFFTEISTRACCYYKQIEQTADCFVAPGDYMCNIRGCERARDDQHMQFPTEYSLYAVSSCLYGRESSSALVAVLGYFDSNYELRGDANTFQVCVR